MIGSIDSSSEICRKFAYENDKIKFFKIKNSGVSTARNVGISKSTGDYAFFVDSDDFLSRDAFSIINKEINNKYINDEDDLIIFEIAMLKNGKIINKKSKLSGKKYNIEELLEKFAKNKTLIERINSVNGKLYNLNIIRNNKIKFNSKIKIGEDLLFNIKYLNYVKTINWKNEMIYNYELDNMNSSTKKFVPNKYSQLLFVSQKFAHFLGKFNNEKIINLYKYIRTKNIFSCLLDFRNVNCNYTSKEKINFIIKIKNSIKKVISKEIGFKYYILACILIVIPTKLILLFFNIAKKYRFLVYDSKTNRR